MNNRKWIFVAVIGVVFLFAGYNLYSYFQEQAAIAAQEERQAEERRIERERVAAEREAARQAEAAQREAELQAARAAEEAQRRADAEAREAARLAEEARQAAADAERIEREREAEAERLRDRIARARELREGFEGIRWDTVEELNVLSSRYVTDHPEEFRDQVFSAANMGAHDRSSIKVFFDDSNPLMLYAAISQDLRLLQALMDVGLDVNGANRAGVTPLMFAAAYNNAEVINFLLERGADASAVSYVEDMNALHFAARYNPNPEATAALLEAGLPLEGATSTGATPALLAASDNRNMEVIELLAQRGADLEVYDQRAQSARLIAEARLGAAGNRAVEMGNTFVPISDAYREQVLSAIRGE